MGPEDLGAMYLVIVQNITLTKRSDSKIQRALNS